MEYIYGNISKQDPYAQRPILIANDAYYGSYYPPPQGQQGLKELMIVNSQPNFEIPMAGYSSQNFFFEKNGDYLDEQSWINNIGFMSDASFNGLFIAGQVNGDQQSYAITDLTQDEYLKYSQYGWVTFLFVVNDLPSNTTIMYGMPTWGYDKNNKQYYRDIPQFFYYDIGSPTQFYANQDVEKYKLNGHESYQREFTKGVVILNPSMNDDNMISFNKKYYDVFNDQYVNNVTVKSQTAYMLFNQKPVFV